MHKESIQLEVVNPRGVVAPPPIIAPAPRLEKLSGKVIGLYSNSKPGMDNFYTAIAQILQKKYPAVTTTVLKGGFEIRDEDVPGWLSQIDTFVYAVGD